MYQRTETIHRPTLLSIIVFAVVLSFAMIALAACGGVPNNPPVIQNTPPETLDTANIQPTKASPDAAQSVVSIPECIRPAPLTPALTEGPYFKANSPERSSLWEAGMAGTQLTLTGYVLSPDCQPIAQTLLDFWQADANGQYDNSGYTLRGHQYTDPTGRYELITVVPGEYPGRTEHIHFKVQAPDGPMLTSQLFFPDVQDNQEDRIFDPSLVITITQDSGSSLQATFDFIIQP